MADKTIGELPKATGFDDESLLVAEQQGEAVSVTGAVLQEHFTSVILDKNGKTDLIPEQTVEFTYSEDGYYNGSVDITVELTEGEKCTVEWDGEVVSCTSKAFDALILVGWYLGNLSIVVSSEEDTGEDFLVLFVSNGTTAFFTKKPDATHTVRVYQAGYKIKEEYLEGTEMAQQVAALEQQVADLLYVPINISSLSHNAGTQEMGATLTSIELTWVTNKTPAELTLDGSTIDSALTGTTLSGLNITNNKTWTLEATDERNATASKTTTVSFLNGVYYGVSAAPDTIDSAFILGLTKELTSTRARSVTVDATDGLYIWYCLPVRLGTCAFTVGGFEGGFDLVDTIDFTNVSGYSESYYVYRSSNASLGSTKVVVS